MHVYTMYLIVYRCLLSQKNSCTCAVKEIEKKWRSLRAQFNREKQNKRKRKSGDGADDLYQIKWAHFEHLKFIDDYVTPKNSQSNLQVNNYKNEYYLTYRMHGNNIVYSLIRSYCLAMLQLLQS